MTAATTGPADAVAAVFADVLALTDVDHHVGFFDLGADSASVVRAVNRLRERWPHLRSVDVFTHPTVADLATYLAASTPAPDSPPGTAGAERGGAPAGTAVNLTEAQARRRAELIDVHSYDISVDLTGAPEGDHTFPVTTTVRFHSRRPGASTVIECAAERIEAATLNGAPITTSGWSPAAGLPLDDLVAGENVLVVRAVFRYAAGQRGMFRAVDPADGASYVYSSFEPSAAQRVFACFDQPDLKARFTWHARVPAGWRAISNMPAAETTVEVAGGSTVHFSPSPPMSPYVAVLCAGPFVEVRHRSGGRDLGIFCRSAMRDRLDTDPLFAMTSRGMSFYEEQFGHAYPLPKLDYVVAPEYRGAMENFGCVVFSERDFVFRSRVTGAERLRRGAMLMHELAHMWFGNLVTMRWWDDLWLNEAFATWASYWCLAAVGDLPEPWADFATQHKARGLKADQQDDSHPVYAPVPDVDTAEVSFDDITYRKGASVIKQLAAHVGIGTFTAALRRYFAAHAWGNATFDDLVRCLETESGRSLRTYVDEWLRTTRTNTLRLEVDVTDDGRYAAAAVLQEAPAASPTLRTHSVRIGVYDRAGTGLTCRGAVQVDVTGPRTAVPELAGRPVADALLLDDTDLTFARLRFDERTTSTVRDLLAEIPEPLSRAVAWASCIDRLHSAELATREFVDMVARCLPRETHSALAGNVLKEAQFALDFFADPGWAGRGRALLAKASLAAAETSGPGSDLQLMWGRAFCSAARGEADLARVRAWYEGAALPPGLPMDEEMRWTALQALVAAGAADPEEVERRFAADTSVGGRYAVSTTRAMVPTAAAKEQAWRAALAPHTSVTIRRAILTGFWHPAQTALTAGYVTRYFDELAEVWHTQDHEAGRYIAQFGFPAVHVCAETIEQATAWCATPGQPAPLTQIVGAATARMRRAVAARQCDAGHGEGGRR